MYTIKCIDIKTGTVAIDVNRYDLQTAQAIVAEMNLYNSHLGLHVLQACG